MIAKTAFSVYHQYTYIHLSRKALALKNNFFCIHQIYINNNEQFFSKKEKQKNNPALINLTVFKANVNATFIVLFAC